MTIPTNLRVPFVFVEFDSSRAFQGASVLNYKVLIIGQRLTVGTKAAGTIDRVTSVDRAKQYYGVGSQLALAFEAWFNNNKFTEVYGYAFNDASGGVAATGQLVVTGTATATGVLYLYVGGKQLAIAIDNTDTPTEIGDKIVAAIGSTMCVTAANTTGTVLITAKNDGEPGNDIDLRCNYNSGEQFPTSVSVAVTAMSGGAGNPDMDTAFAAMADEWFQIIVGPYTDATNLSKIEEEMEDRFGAIRQIDCVYICSKRADLAALQSFGGGRNSKQVSCIHSYACPTPSFEVAAAYAGQVAYEGSVDPARPFHTLELKGVLPPAYTARMTMAENNSLLFTGISTFQVDSAGKVRIQAAITMYQQNEAGADDIAYYSVNTRLTLLYLRYDFRTQIMTRYARAKLADDGVQVGPGQQVITPKVGKAEAIAIFRGWEYKGLVENADQFARDLTCIRNPSDPNRLDWVLPPDLMNQFVVGAAQIQFLLQSPTA
jgi:phage tail sheath gpL-like